MKRDDQQPLTAAIIGTGFGGIGMAIRLREAGITDFVILETANRIGGTWRDNTYPGAPCDVPSPPYSFSFKQEFDWPRFFLSGRRVGVSGIGASPVQFMANVVDKAAQVTLFQRTAPYVLPKPDRKISRIEHWLHSKVPPLRQLVRGSVYSVFESLGVGLLKRRPVLAPLKALWAVHLRLTIKDPELRRKLTPDYPPTRCSVARAAAISCKASRPRSFEARAIRIAT
jgi:cation diffusion facilitator CzcD-associated flavoprotein CzcO